MGGSCEDFVRFFVVCKSQQSVTFKTRQDGSTFLLSSESPLLLLAEEVPEGSLRCCDINVDEDGLEEEEPNDDENMEEEYEDEDADEDQNGQEEEDEEGDHFPDEEGHDNENGGFGGKPVYSLSWQCSWNIQSLYYWVARGG